MPFAAFVAVTVAPGTTPPLESVTVPVSVPRMVWATPDAASPATRAATRTIRAGGSTCCFSIASPWFEITPVIAVGGFQSILSRVLGPRPDCQWGACKGEVGGQIRDLTFDLRNVTCPWRIA